MEHVVKDGPHSGLHGGQFGIEVTPDVLSIADDVIELSCNRPHLLLHLLRTAYGTKRRIAAAH